MGSYKVERDWSIAKLKVIKEMKCLGLNKCVFLFAWFVLNNVIDFCLLSVLEDFHPQHTSCQIFFLLMNNLILF